MNNNYPYNGNGYMPYQNYGQGAYMGQNYYGQNNQMNANVQQMQPQNIPIVDIRFVNAEEVDKFIVFPNTAVLLIDKSNNLAYLKILNANNECSIRKFSYGEMSKNNEPIDKKQEPKIDMAQYVKIEDLKAMGLITNAQYQENQKALIQSFNERLKELQARFSGVQPNEQ